MTTGAVEGFDGNDARVARERLGLTQFAVAAELGITPQHVSNFERGRHQLSTRLRWRLADLLGLPTDGMQPAPESRLDAMRDDFEALHAEIGTLHADMTAIKDQMADLARLVTRAMKATAQVRAADAPAPSSRRHRSQEG